MSMTHQQLALCAIRKAHVLCVKRSGNNAFADIPMNISISSVRVDEDSGGRRGRIATHRVRIRPDTARLLDPQRVSDEFYESICNHRRTVTEGEGAEQLYGLLRTLCGQADAEKPVRYSLNAERDRQLIRSYLWREGYDWRRAEGMERPLMIVDVRHALTIIAGISRTMSLKGALPRELQDYDLDSFDLDATELCRLFGVAAPNEDAESSGLLRLLLAAREGQYVPKDKSERLPERLRALKALGDILDHLEGLAGATAEDHAPARQVKRRDRRLVAPLGHEIGLTPADMGLLWHQGVWLPVAPPPFDSHQAHSTGFMYALPDGQALPIEENMSAPLVRLDLLSSEGGWDAAADQRLRRICGWEGEPVSLRALIETYRQSSSDWSPPASASPSDPAANSNTWTRMSNGLCEARHYALAGKVLHAINGGDADGAHRALAELAEQASTGTADGNASLPILLANLRLSASRADLLNDERELWLRQMALLLVPEAWPGSRIVDSERLPVILFGDGPVARHNRIAVASRSSLGVPVSNAVRAALSAPPRSLGAEPVIN